MWKVLVIEDDPMLADIHRKHIENQVDFKCVGVVYDAAKGLEAIQSKKPDLILLDVYMPQLNGLDFLINLREQQIDVDIILITAAKSIEQVKTAYRYGAIDYLVKPFEFSRLDKALDTFRSRRSTLSSGKIASQEMLDSIFIKNHHPKVIELPKGLHERTLKRVMTAITKFEASFSIDDIVTTVDISKVTLRRYLEYLEKTGVIEIEMSYGSRGRPSYKYKLTKRF